MDNEQNILLHEKLGIYPGEDKCDVSVTNDRILIIKEGLSVQKCDDVIELKDVIGCHILHDKKKPVIPSYLCIFSYPMRKKKLGSGVVRQRMARTFAMNTKNTYHENLMLAEMWKVTIKRLVAGEVIKTKRDLENGALKTRNLLVLVNPFSGKKKALAMYKEKVQPMFAEAEIKHTVKTTEFPGHAKEIAQTLNLDKWDGIVIISGDGLVHEVINGLMNREDWREAIKMPLGVVPGGSGNALAAAVIYASTGQVLSNNLELDAIFEVVKGKQRKMSLVAAETGAGQKFYSFLNFAWGFIADVDIESERFRKLGPVRFTLGCALRVANMRLYQGRISYLPASNTEAYSYGWTHSLRDEPNGPNRSFKHKSMSVPANIVSSRSSISFDDAALSMVEDTVNDNTNSSASALTHNGHSSKASDETNNARTDVLSIGEPNSTETRSKAACFINGHESCVVGAGDFKSPKPKEEIENYDPVAWKDSALCYHLRTSLDADPPDDWITVESEFVWVTSVYLSHLGNEMMGVPSARLDDDVMYIYTLRHGISKAKMVNVLMGFEAGTHIERGGEYSFVAPCKAVRLEPFTFITGHMTVDGELVPHCPIQASVTPHKVSIMSSVSDR